MSETSIPKSLEQGVLDEAQVQAVAGGDLCSGEDLVRLTASLIQTYENLVAFTSHVIGRVSGEN